MVAFLRSFIYTLGIVNFVLIYEKVKKLPKAINYFDHPVQTFMGLRRVA
jgi:hypothetical protein